MESTPVLTGSLRERGKARRIGEIVNAAADLWREHGIDRVSLNQIAAQAEVSPQTVYNLIGGLDAIGFAVLRLALARMDKALSETCATGIELALCSSRICVELYTADPLLYRQVLVRVPRALLEGTHLGQDTGEIAKRAMAEAQDAGEILADIDPVLLGRTIYTNFLGAVYDWACGDSGDEEFRRAAELAVLAPTAACVNEGIREQLNLRFRTTLMNGCLVEPVNDF